MKEKQFDFSDVTLSILAYKKSRHLEQCIRSVLAMRGVEQAVVLLATSTPNEWIERMGKKYHLPVCVRKDSCRKAPAGADEAGKKQGRTEAAETAENRKSPTIGADFQFGIDAAKTRLVTVVHQDDVYGKNYLVEMLAHLNAECERGHKPLIAFCDYYELKQGAEPPKKLKRAGLRRKASAAAEGGGMQSFEGKGLRVQESGIQSLEGKSPCVQRSEMQFLGTGFRIEAWNRNLVVKRLMNAFFQVPWGRTSVWWRRRILSLGCSICCPSVMFVRENLLTDVFSAGMYCNVDWEAWERLSKNAGAFIYVSRPLMLHRVYEESTTTDAIRGSLRTEEDYKMFCKFWPEKLAKLLMYGYQKGQEGNFR